MKSKRLDKLTIYVVALLVIAIFCGEILTMVAIAYHECQGSDCIKIVHGEQRYIRIFLNDAIKAF